MLALLRRASPIALALSVFLSASAQASPRGETMYRPGVADSPFFARAVSRAGSRVVAEAERWQGRGNVTGTAGAWCADFVSFVLRRSGKPPLASRMASSGLSYGEHVAHPRPGDIVVMNTRYGRAAHVGFVVADLGARIEIISGNWGHRVAYGVIPRRSVVAFVRT